MMDCYTLLTSCCYDLSMRVLPPKAVNGKIQGSEERINCDWTPVLSQRKH